MSTTAAAMSQLLTLTQERAYYQMQQIYWSNEHTAMTAKVKQHQKYETEWNNAFDKVMDAEEGKRIAEEKIDFYPEAKQKKNDELLLKVGTQVISSFENDKKA